MALRNVKSRSSRFLPASVFLVLGFTALYFMDVIGLASSSSPVQNSQLNSNGKTIFLRRDFHLLSFLDPLFREVTVGFLPAIFDLDSVSHWQMLSFMTDVGPLYMVWLLESSRAGNKGTVAYFPALFATIAQIAGGGFFIPIYFGAFIAFCPPTSTLIASARRIDLSDAALYLPLVLVLHFYPVLAMLLSTNYADREYWMWFWQLYSVRISVAYFVIKFVFRMLPLEPFTLKLRYQTCLRLVLGPIIAISAAVWIHILVNSPHSLTTLFVPGELDCSLESEFFARMRKTLQYDGLFCFGAAFLWLVVLAIDMGRASFVSATVRAVVAVASVRMVGPGATFGMLWLWRESSLVNDNRNNRTDYK